MLLQGWREFAASAPREARMTEWHERSGADILIRVGGLALIALASLAAAALRHRALVDVRLEDDPLAYLLALAAFVAGSFGCASLALGHHLFDRIEIARRWQPFRRDD